MKRNKRRTESHTVTELATGPQLCPCHVCVWEWIWKVRGWNWRDTLCALTLSPRPCVCAQSPRPLVRQVTMATCVRSDVRSGIMRLLRGARGGGEGQSDSGWTLYLSLELSLSPSLFSFCLFLPVSVLSQSENQHTKDRPNQYLSIQTSTSAHWHWQDEDAARRQQ